MTVAPRAERALVRVHAVCSVAACGLRHFSIDQRWQAHLGPAMRREILSCDPAGNAESLSYEALCRREGNSKRPTLAQPRSAGVCLCRPIERMLPSRGPLRRSMMLDLMELL